MNQPGFGQLVGHLRKEIGLTRKELTDEVNNYLETELGNTAIRDVELGRRRLTREELSALASVLRLSSRERKEFFFASMNIEADDVQPKADSQDAILDSVLNDIQGLQCPFLLLDKYHYILATNSTASVLFSLSYDQLTHMFDAPVLRYNLIAILFSNNFQQLIKLFQMEPYDRTITRSMQVFRSATLAYRFSPDYQALSQELQKFPFFKVYWEQAVVDERDEFRNQRSYPLIHPYYGALQMVTVLSITSTPYGNLYLATYLPVNVQTDDAFRTMANETPFRIIRLSHWRS